MAEYAQVECHDCFGVFPGSMMRRKSQSKSAGKSVQKGNYIENSGKLAQDVTTQHYETTEVILCPNCLSKRRLKTFATWVSLAAAAAAGIYWFSTQTTTSSTDYNLGAPSEEITNGETGDQNMLAVPYITDSYNEQYSVAYNGNGAVLTSNSDIVSLGISCDASSKKWGPGNWQTRDAYLLVVFRKHRLEFVQHGMDLGCKNAELANDELSTGESTYQTREEQALDEGVKTTDAGRNTERESELNNGANAPSNNLIWRTATPKGNVSGWANTNDYPSLALQQEREGTTAFELTVGPNGRVVNCEIVSSSGHQDLDQATCINVTRRARFDPALNERGEPIIGSYYNRIRWQVPRN